MYIISSAAFLLKTCAAGAVYLADMGKAYTAAYLWLTLCVPETKIKINHVHKNDAKKQYFNSEIRVKENGSRFRKYNVSMWLI